MNYFVTETPDVLEGWDGENHVSTIRSKPDWRRLTRQLPCGDGFIEVGFTYNGATVGPLRFLFPKWKHPIATARHDKRCAEAKTKEERKIADDLFMRDVGVNGTKLEQHIGYAGVRTGAFFTMWGKP